MLPACAVNVMSETPSLVTADGTKQGIGHHHAEQGLPLIWTLTQSFKVGSRNCTDLETEVQGTASELVPMTSHPP